MYTVHPPRLTFTHLEGHWRRTRSVERESERERGQFSVYYQLYKITFSTVIATELIRDIQFIHHNSTLPVVERKRKKIYIYIHHPLEFMTRTFVDIQQISRTINDTAHSLWKMKKNIYTQ